MKSKFKNLNRLILTDCDGVCLDWEYAFNVWMQEHGFTEVLDSKLSYDMSIRYNIPKEQVRKLIKNFNESAAIGFLPAHRDAMYYIKRLHEEHGFRFHAITSLSLDPNAQKLREMNLHKLFGVTAFERIVCLNTGAHKDEALEEYEGTGCWWIEDKPENADVGHKMGLKSILVEHGHNMHLKCPYPIVKNWKQIYHIITDYSA